MGETTRRLTREEIKRSYPSFEVGKTGQIPRVYEAEEFVRGYFSSLCTEVPNVEARTHHVTPTQRDQLLLQAEAHDLIPEASSDQVA